jgi:hypothetical protein
MEPSKFFNDFSRACTGARVYAERQALGRWSSQAVLRTPIALQGENLATVAAIGIATAAFSLAPEYKLVTGKDPFTRSHVDQIADLVCEFLFIRVRDAQPHLWVDSGFATGNRMTNLPVFSPL